MNGNKNTVRLAGIAYESLVNGPGIRRVLFSQGCIHKCKDCFNPDTHCFDGGKDYDVQDLINDIKGNPLLKGITFSGGDPFEQADKFAYIAEKSKEVGLNIWSYTGYTFEYILANYDKKTEWRELLNSIDVLVDGKFISELQVDGLRYKGSTNQRIIDVKESLKLGKVVSLTY